MTKLTERRRPFLLASIAAGALSLGMAAPTLAQTAAAAEQGAPQAAAGGSTSLEAIVVTARKRTENLVSVPISVSALSANDLQARGIKNFVNLQDYTPGFKFINQSVNRNDRGYSSFIIRGMNPGTPTSYAQGVSIFIDGVPVAGGVISGLNDIERVEVVKGPQSAYFGRSTFAGAVNFITLEPSFVPHALVDTTYQSFGTYDVAGEVEGPIIADKLAVRLALRTFHTDGQYSNPEYPGERLGEQGTNSVSGDVLFRPTDKLSIRAYGKYWIDDDGPAATPYIYPSQYNCNASQAGFATPAIQFVNGKNYVCGALPAFTNASLALNTHAPQAVFDVLNGKMPALISGLYRTADVATHRALNNFGLNRQGISFHTVAHYGFDNGFSIDANVGHDENNWQFMADIGTKDLRSTPNPNYGSANPNYNAVNTPGQLPYTVYDAMGKTDDVDNSAEIRLTSPQASRLKYMIGFSYYQQTTKLDTLSVSNSGYSQITAYQANKNYTPAVFGSVSLDLPHNLNLSFEAREQWDEIVSQSFRAGLKFDSTFQSFNPRVILTYRPTSETTLYASYSEGTRPGLFNTSFASLPAAYQAQITAVAPVSIAVPEENVKMAEIGGKARLFDNRLQILSAFYYGDWTGRHISDKVYYTDNTGFLSNAIFTVAGGETLLYGVELEGEFQATRELLFEGTFDYAGTNIRKDYCGDCLLITGNAFPKGTRMPGYPAFTGSLAGTYTRHAFADYDGFLRLEYVYTGNIYIDDANVAGTGAANKINLHVGVNNGRYRLEVFGTNLTNDKHYIFGQRYSDALPAAGSGIAARPPVNEISVSAPDKPMYGVRLTASF